VAALDRCHHGSRDCSAAAATRRARAPAAGHAGAALGLRTSSTTDKTGSVGPAGGTRPVGSRAPTRPDLHWCKRPPLGPPSAGNRRGSDARHAACRVPKSLAAPSSLSLRCPASQGRAPSSSQRLVKAAGQLISAGLRGGRQGSDDQTRPAGKAAQPRRGHVLQATSHSVAHHSATNGTCHGERRLRRGGVSRINLHVNHDCRVASRASRSPPPPDRVSDHSAPSEPVLGWQGHASQTVSRPRPLARRADRIARPARVRIRRRKPCVLARRRLLGWKVRLLTIDSLRQLVRSGGCCLQEAG
jgi:hypothetical protein